MEAIKLAAGLACGLILLLCSVLVFVSTPENERYEQTVETLKRRQGLSSVEEVLAVFPQLQGIQLKIRRISYLHDQIHRITEGPAPDVSEEESRCIQAYMEEIHQLRQHVKQGLAQFDTIVGQP
ncbi:MAG: hypothetical protein D6772_06140 [Bacteroidetes bacterium]|nr:MAG: hypothetical protein D6772_06140 [Bacteroidota bacterium]